MQIYPRFVPVFFVCIIICGCETTQSGGDVREPKSTVSPNTISGVAEVVESSVAGRFSGDGSGISMAPVYGDNTVLVIQEIAYEDLEVDMMVAYLDRWERHVVHQLVRKTAKGWVAQGINNRVEDTELVTPENLLGVVYAVLNASPENPIPQ